MRKPPKKDPAPAGPTVQDVEALFHELIPDRYSRKDLAESHPDVLLAAEAVEKRERDLAHDHSLTTLRQRLEIVKREAYARQVRNAHKAEKVRREYRAKGLTPEVAKLIAKLVAEVNKS